MRAGKGNLEDDEYKEEFGSKKEGPSSASNSNNNSSKGSSFSSSSSDVSVRFGYRVFSLYFSSLLHHRPHLNTITGQKSKKFIPRLMKGTDEQQLILPRNRDEKGLTHPTPSNKKGKDKVQIQSLKEQVRYLQQKLVGGGQDFLANVAQVAREEAIRHMEDVRQSQEIPRTNQEDPRNTYSWKNNTVFKRIISRISHFCIKGPNTQQLLQQSLQYKITLLISTSATPVTISHHMWRGNQFKEWECRSDGQIQNHYIVKGSYTTNPILMGLRMNKPSTTGKSPQPQAKTLD
ncbi:uncharacterized protein G2W53_014275 [Senna tora]|uniref:Uncharacterized protein n=1 Tax=Senna tora TaxID=362788 RepID=A0A834WT80_9FABA|nr:uncharacterized protein G2W53_014275 [Senna tora]